METFTSLRQQTAIDKDGIAQENTLRTSRVLQKGLTFYSKLEILPNAFSPGIETLFALSATVFRRLGKMRNRGLGEIGCHLLENGVDVSVKKLKEVENLIIGKGGIANVSA